MDQNSQSGEKQTWHRPEVIEVGGVSDVTTGGTGNLTDGGSGTDHYKPWTRTGNSDGEVDLEDR